MWLLTQIVRTGFGFFCLLGDSCHLLPECSFPTRALHHSVTDLLSLRSSSAPCPETIAPHVTGSMVVCEWTSSGDSPCAELDRRKVRSDRAMEWRKLEELGSKSQAKLYSRGKRGTGRDIQVRSERVSYGLGRRAVQWLCLCTKRRRMGEGSRLVEHNDFS